MGLETAQREEDAVRDRRDGPGAKPAARKRRSKVERPAEIVALEERLADNLGTTVNINYGARGGGKMVIKFGSLDDLERIYRGLLGG